MLYRASVSNSGPHKQRGSNSCEPPSLRRYIATLKFLWPNLLAELEDAGNATDAAKIIWPSPRLFDTKYQIGLVRMPTFWRSFFESRKPKRTSL